MQKLQDSVFSITKTTNLSPAVFSFLQPTEDISDKTPLGGILSDTKHGWLALGPKFCVIDLRSGLKIAARIFGNSISSRTSVTSVVELPTPLTPNSQQLLISLECDDVTGMICVFHINGSQVLHCIQTDVVVTELAVCDDIPSGPLMCYDGLVMAGTRKGEVFVFDLNRACIVDALKNISQGHEDEIHDEVNAANLVFLPLKALHKIESQRDLAVDNHDHLAVLLNENSLADGQYIFRNPDGTVRMKAKRDHIRVTVVQYIPQLASLAVGYNFGAFQIWNLMNLDLEFTSQVNVECLPVTHFGFQEPCDDPRAFCYLWVVFSVIDRFEEEEFPLAVMYSLTYQGKRMMNETACLYQEFSTATIRFQIELSSMEDTSEFVGGRCVSCHTYSVNSALGDDGDDSVYTNICQLVWECWGERATGTQLGTLLFDLDQWYKDQMPATHRLESNAFMSASWCGELGRGARALHVRLDPASVAPYAHATRLEEHFYPNSLQYNCICLTTSEAMSLHTAGVQRQLVSSLAAAGPACLLAPARLRAACARAGLAPLYRDPSASDTDPEEQRRYLLSVALEARLSGFLKRCAHDWATGTHSGSGCTLTFLVDWCWKRAIELKENAKELTAPLFTSSTLPDRNVVRCLEHCVQQLTQLTGLLDAVLTKCCNLVVPDALSEMEEKLKGISTVSLYFQVVQWFLRVGLLPERMDGYSALPYPAHQLYTIYNKRRLKLQRLEDKQSTDNENESCSLLYIDQLIEHEFGGERTHQAWVRGGSESGGLYPPPSLYALLRLYLLPEIAEEHKHSIVLYLLLDYSMVYDDMRYEEVIRRLMQFPTMFGLSNTAIKATQAFWHLDHRDFDFALDQLQCLTGNTLAQWQHAVALASLLAQKKTQAALQYLHVRKPAPVRRARDNNADYSRISEQDKLEDWQSCCNLYLARGLVFEALDVVRTCVHSAASTDDKAHLINYFYKGCRNTGQLAKVLNITLLPFEEEAFIKYLQNSNEPQTSDILIMYYLQQARYLEAQQYNNKIKSKGRPKEMSTSVESLLDVMDREGARDTLVDVMCSALPPIANCVARCARVEFEPHIVAAKPMSVFVQANSPKNTFTYKSSFIQDTIENASETWVNKPQMRRGIKRALEVEETPFICTPKLFRTKSLFSEQQGSESTPPKRAKLDLSGAARTPKSAQTPLVSEKLSQQMATLLDMPEVQSPGYRPYTRSGAETPQSILKTRRAEGGAREAPSPADSRYLADSDDELLETASNHTHCSDSKHLRFTIPTASEASSTPSPAHPVPSTAHIYKLEQHSDDDEKIVEDDRPAVSPPKKLAVEEMKPRKSYKDTVKARRSLSISANSSLSDDPNTSIESIADIPITLINPKYSGERRLARERSETQVNERGAQREKEVDDMDRSLEYNLPAPKIPQSRKSIRTEVSFTCRSRSVTPERRDSPIQVVRVTRSRSRTPELSPRLSPLAPIPEMPKQESNSEPHPTATPLSIPRPIRSRSRTPDSQDTVVSETRLEPITESPTKAAEIEVPARPSSRRSLRQRSKTPERMDRDMEVVKLEAIKESPTTTSDTESPLSSPTRRTLRSRSRTPEIEVLTEQPVTSPRSLRSRSKTPEKLMSPKKETTRSRKSLSRMVLEANAFAKTKQNIEKAEQVDTELDVSEVSEQKATSPIECTPMKSSKESPKLMDVNFSPIVNKSVLQSSSESIFSVSTEKLAKTDDESIGIKSLPAFSTISESYAEKSVLHSYQSSIVETSSVCAEEEKIETSNVNVTSSGFKSLSTFKTINETELRKSILRSVQSSMAESSMEDSRFEKIDEEPKTFTALKSLNETEFGKSLLRSEDSSVAMTSDESFAKDNRTDSATRNQNISSLITDDSDVEMKEWIHKMDSQETARVIQKEKEKIVEIEREINEIEDDMSDDCQVEDDSDSEDQNEEEESDVDSNEESSENIEEGSESDREIISIEDSDESSVSVNSGKSSSGTENVENTSPQEEVPEQGLNIDIIQTIEIETVSENPKESAETSEIAEASTDPLNQAQVSMLTDDSSVAESEFVNLNYSDETKPEKEQESNQPEVHDIEMEQGDKKVEIVVVVEAIDPPTEDIQLPIGVCESVDEVDFKNDKINQNNEEVISEGNKTSEVQKKQEEIVKEVVEMEVEVENAENKEIEENAENKEVEENVQIKEIEENVEIQEIEENVEIKEIEENVEIKEIKENVEKKEIEENLENKEFEENIENKEIEKEKPAPNTDIPVEEKGEESKKDAEAEKPEPATPIRKRIKSTSSTKSSKDIEKAEIITEEPKTPRTRKRTQSTASNKSIGDEPEEIKTPRGRAMTPTNEIRKILTRRASKELGEKLDESDINPDDVLTPRRRTTRSRSKNIDDNASVASEGSVKSAKSKASVDTDVRPGSARKGRKKPDLSVIPEVTAEESGIRENTQEIVNEYSGSRRLTRHQKTLLNTWIEPKSVPRRLSQASRSEASRSEASLEGDDDDLPHVLAFDVQPIDRITLLNKTDFQGSPDDDEMSRTDSPLSFLSETRPRNRLARAASESKSTSKPARITRNASVDLVLGTPELGSPASRGRRASFNKACEALQTPKGRRPSVDIKRAEVESPPVSPAKSEVVTPARRGRRVSAASAASAASATKEPGKRTKKTAEK